MDIKGIYQIRCIANDKVYIGSSFNIELRWHYHLEELRNGSHKNKHLQKDYILYGDSSFEFTILHKAQYNDRYLLYWDEMRRIDAIENKYNIMTSKNAHFIAPRKDESGKRKAWQGVYQIRCDVNGLVYIGSSGNTFTRIKGHFKKLRKSIHNNKRLQSDFNKYGEFAFSIAILEETDFDFRSDLYEVEQKWLDATNNKYNELDNAFAHLKHKAKASKQPIRRLY